MRKRIVEPRFFGRVVKRTVVRILEFLMPAPVRTDKYEGIPGSILIIAQEKLGDSILLTPLLNNLRKSIPGAQIHVAVVRPSIGQFFKDDPNIDRIINVRGRMPAAIREIRRQTYDVLYNTKDHLSFTFVWLTLFARARHKVGIKNPHYSKFYNHLMEVDESQHIALKNCALLDYLGCSYTIQECRPYLPPGEISDEIREFAARIPSGEYIGINLSTGDPDRALSIGKWEEVIERIPVNSIVFSTPEDFPLKQRIEERFGHVVQSPPTKTLAEVGELLKKLRVLLTPDTSMIHLASCFNIPVIGLYQNQDALQGRFYPFLIKHRIIASQSRFVDDLPVDEIVSVALEAIELLAPG